MGIEFSPGSDFTRIVELTPAMRKHIEATIENLIDLLDALDGDTGREEDADFESELEI